MTDIKHLNRWLNECFMLHDAIISKLIFSKVSPGDNHSQGMNVLEIEFKLPVDISCEKYSAATLVFKGVDILTLDLDCSMDALYVTNASVSKENYLKVESQEYFRMKIFGSRYLADMQKWRDRLFCDVCFEEFDIIPVMLAQDACAEEIR